MEFIRFEIFLFFLKISFRKTNYYLSYELLISAPYELIEAIYIHDFDALKKKNQVNRRKNVIQLKEI